MQEPLNISPEISHALNVNEPVVALESSVIAQGLPADVNVKTALEMEDVVRKQGAVPATIGVIDGKIRVGLTKEEIERLGEGKAEKVNSRDLPYAVLRGVDGGTTVSATARTALAAGIPIMATGGIGGVHRGYGETFDISLDLWEMVRTPIIVVCSGAKAVLDIPATCEWLETHDVPVYGYGADEMPAFYSRSTGIKVPRVEDAREVAEISRLSRCFLGVRCAIIIANPIPEADVIDVTGHIEIATKEAVDKGIRGKELTPYLLKRVGEFTDGKSIDANIALLKNNAGVAAQIARAVIYSDEHRMGFRV